MITRRGATGSTPRVDRPETARIARSIGGQTNGNPYDGHCLDAQLLQFRRLTGRLSKTAIVDRGYRGIKVSVETEIVHPNQSRKYLEPYHERKRKAQLRSRASIEPVMGHLKTDHRLIRNFLKGTNGDKINTILAEAAFNFRK